MDLNDLIEPGRVLCNVEARSRKHALEIISELLAQAEPNLTQSEIFTSLVTREKLGSTALGKGVAVPHGRIEGLEESVGALMKLSDPIDFDADDVEPVQLIFGLLVPLACDQGHFDGVARIARMFSEDAFRETLQAATSSRTLFDVLVNHHDQDEPLTAVQTESSLANRDRAAAAVEQPQNRGAKR